MTRSSTNKLFTPYKEPEREFRSSRKYFKTLSLNELRSPNFNLFSDQEYSEEEVAKTMAETMEQYISKTRADYGSGVARPKIENKDNFELKGQFLKELRTNTFSGSDHKDVNEYIEKVLEIVDLFHIPNITINQVMLRAFPMYLTGATSRTIPSKTVVDTKIAIQEMAEYSQKWHNGTSKLRSTKTSDELEAIQAQLNNLEREIKKVNKKVYAAQVGCEQCKGPHNTKDFPLNEEEKTLEEAYYLQFEKKESYGPQFSEAYSEASQYVPQKEKVLGSFTLPSFINNVCFDNAFVDLGASVSVMPLLTYLNLGLGELAHTKLTIELADKTVKYPKGIAEKELVRIGKFVFPVDFVILDMPEDIKVPLILERSFLSTARAKIDVYKRKFTLRVGEEKVVFTSVKPASSLIKRVYMLSLRERMELDLEVRLIGETLVLNRSLDPFLRIISN
nr:hypothetical protein [Tanacetum cinerariifolium]